jgi:hypothetical protein
MNLPKGLPFPVNAGAALGRLICFVKHGYRGDNHLARWNIAAS